MRTPTRSIQLIFIAVGFVGIGALHILDAVYSIDGVRFSRTQYGKVAAMAIFGFWFLNLVILAIRINIDRIRKRGIERALREQRLDLESMNPVQRSLLQNSYSEASPWKVAIVCVLLAVFLVPIVLFGGLLLLIKILPPPLDVYKPRPAVEASH